MPGYHGVGQEQPTSWIMHQHRIKHGNIVHILLPIVNTILKANLNFVLTLNCIIIGLTLGQSLEL